MGTGKTAVGKEVARQLSQKFLDLDLFIEQGQNKKINQIFAEDGEAQFRLLEKQALNKISAKENLVVSCGGGIVLDKENIQTMKKTGIMICLNASPEIILARTQRYRHRPLLNVDNPQDKIEELLGIRAPFYSQADYTVDTSDLSIAEVVNRVLEHVREKNT